MYCDSAGARRTAVRLRTPVRGGLGSRARAGVQGCGCMGGRVAPARVRRAGTAASAHAGAQVL